MGIESIVNVTIDRRTRAPSQRGFGTPLIAAYHNNWTSRVRLFTEADQLLEEGFTTSSKVYRDAVALKSQNPCVESFKVGRRTSAFTQTVHLIPDSLEVGFEYSGRVNSTAWSYVVETGDTTGDVVEGIADAMSDIPGIVVSDEDTHVECVASVAGVVHTYRAVPELHMEDVTEDPGIVDDLAAIRAADDDWYGLILDSNSAEEITAAAAWAETQMILLGVHSADWAILDPSAETDIASQLLSNAYARTFGAFHRQIGSSLPAAWMGRELPVNPGIDTWAFKTLTGIDVDRLAPAEQGAIEAKFWSHYQQTGGLNITFEGQTPSREYVDLVQGSDWIKARMTEAVFGVLATSSKVPFTDSGIDQIATAVHTTLQRASSANNPILDPNSIVVRVPTVADVPLADRATRTLPNVYWEARFTGAIHKVKPLRGTVTV